LNADVEFVGRHVPALLADIARGQSMGGTCEQCGCLVMIGEPCPGCRWETVKPTWLGQLRSAALKSPSAYDMEPL
jgi:hypothetical protein